jgi:hypothetical protein
VDGAILIEKMNYLKINIKLKYPIAELTVGRIFKEYRRTLSERI